jgi:hypothetical protein
MREMRVQETPAREMTHEEYLSFVVLRKTGRIGRVWPVAGGYKLAPLTYPDGTKLGFNEHNTYVLAEFITTEKLLALIDELSGLRHEKRKPVVSSQRVNGDEVSERERRGFHKVA